MKTPLGFVVLISLFLFSSCAAVVKTDTLPKDSPKGYVEFYKVWLPPIPAIVPNNDINVYEIVNGRDVFLVQIGKISGKINERVAFLPGDHTFKVSYISSSTISKTVTIPVQENMIIPVRMDLRVEVINRESAGTDLFDKSVILTRYNFNVETDLHIENARKAKRR